MTTTNTSKKELDALRNEWIKAERESTKAINTAHELSRKYKKALVLYILEANMLNEFEWECNLSHTNVVTLSCEDKNGIEKIVRMAYASNGEVSLHLLGGVMLEVDSGRLLLWSLPGDSPPGVNVLEFAKEHRLKIIKDELIEAKKAIGKNLAEINRLLSIVGDI